MKLLYSNILPLRTEEDQETIMDCFTEQMKMADRVEIAVGYTSNASLAELDWLVDECHISKVCLNIGMYFIEGMPEGAYHTAIKINEKWQEAGIGEIRIVKAFKYHGKLFVFIKMENHFQQLSVLQILELSSWKQAIEDNMKCLPLQQMNRKWLRLRNILKN